MIVVVRLMTDRVGYSAAVDPVCIDRRISLEKSKPNNNNNNNLSRGCRKHNIK